MPGVLNLLPALLLPLLVFHFFFLVPLRKVRRARAWREVPCEIVSSSVREDATDSGLYRFQVAYRYAVAGEEHRSGRYNFSFATATVGFFGKRRLARRLAPGTRTVCYVDPADPAEAVLDRGMTWDMLFAAAFAIMCGAVFLMLWRQGAL